MEAYIHCTCFLYICIKAPSDVIRGFLISAKFEKGGVWALALVSAPLGMESRVFLIVMYMCVDCK